MERKLTMKFKSSVLRKWEAEHGGLSILTKAIPVDIVNAIYDLFKEAKNNKENSNNGITKDAIISIYNTINRVISIQSLSELIQVGNLNTIDLDAASDKLDNYLEKYPEEGIVGAYLQLLKELDSDMSYLGKVHLSIEKLIDTVAGQVDDKLIDININKETQEETKE